MTNSTAERVAALLFAFAPGPDGRATDLSVSEVARQIGRERSQVSRMLKSLQQAGLVEQDPESRRYRLTWRTRALAASAGDPAVVAAVRPILQVLVTRTGEVALLSVQAGNRSLTVLREESNQSLRGGGWVGRASPMHNSASGRALLFDADDETVEALTVQDLATRTGPRAPKSLDELLDRLREERRQGYTFATEELEVGLTSFSAPVRNLQGEILAVVNVSGPTARLLDRRDAVAKLLLAATSHVSNTISSRSP